MPNKMVPRLWRISFLKDCPIRDKSFYDPLKKRKLKTFTTMNKSKEYKWKEKVVTLQANKEIFCKLAIIAQKIYVDLAALFKYPLGPLPLALAEPNGTLKKTVKSSLLHKFEEDVDPAATIIGTYAFIADGLACIRQLKVSKSTYLNSINFRTHLIFAQSRCANKWLREMIIFSSILLREN